MVRLTVLYGHPEDPAQFDRYYREVHIPLARMMKGLTGWTIGKCESVEPSSEPPYYFMVGLYAESAEAMQAILESQNIIFGSGRRGEEVSNQSRDT